MPETDRTILMDMYLEFIEALFHQILYHRQLYAPTMFERTKLYGIVVRRARHPELVEYIKDIVTGLKVSTFVYN